MAEFIDFEARDVGQIEDVKHKMDEVSDSSSSFIDDETIFENICSFQNVTRNYEIVRLKIP